MGKAGIPKTCGICHNRIEEGDEIRPFRDGTAHESCMGTIFKPEFKHGSKSRGRRPKGGRFKL